MSHNWPELSAAEVNELLAAHYPAARCELNFSTPFELLVATVLSAQCTDERVNQVTPALFARYPDALAMAAATRKDLEEILRPLGFQKSKAGYLLGIGEALVARHGGEVPESQEALESLPGVGRKTALVVRGNAFGHPGLAVDTHVTRVSKRLGIATGGTPLAIEKQLCAGLPAKEWTDFSHRVIVHGRRCCTARKPHCGRCVLNHKCESAVMDGE
ncbi:hypothetical protein CPHO_01110 [Corynebacterium phocae]|uniref:Endonuclease III n=1 Tax=Corynebacterium phocae TaxID=161895 RepID=A0A1L7D0Y4_9CORY|nr:endonuclease III [Corynebacterium phocae]APT91750.1 hypothetical protein CPHO_01110 [Corynebacterium phocae]KAA8728514.1 endonuclease III [Corynebacterium phocae]